MLTKANLVPAMPLLLAVASLPLLYALSSGRAHAAARCKHIEATVTLTASTATDCQSQIGLCATGVLDGDLKGTSSFIGTSSTTTADTPSSGVVFVTGDNRIETSRGTLLTKDAIALQTTGNGEFAEVDVIVGGSGTLAGSTGSLTATGTFIDGAGEGRLTGELCMP